MWSCGLHSLHTYTHRPPSVMINIREKLIEKQLEAIGFFEIARETGFDNAHTKKITAFDFLMGCLLMLSKAGVSLEDWASCIGQISGQPVSRQAVFLKHEERHVECFTRTVEAALSEAFRQRLAYLNPALLESFPRVLVEDSTLLSLQERLAAAFPAAHNAPGGSARMRWVFDLKSEQALAFTLGSFRTNDQSQAGLIFDVLAPGDLLLRDLGYFSTPHLRQITERGAFFLSRLRYRVTVYDAETHKALDLVALARATPGSVIDRRVLLGQNEQVPVRLVGLRLPPQQVDARRRKARQARHSRTNHTEHYVEWLAWSFYVTNVEANLWSASALAEVYRLRWRIEMIFKAIKSGLKTRAALEADPNYNRARIVLHGIVLFVLLVLLPTYRQMMHAWSVHGAVPRLSLVKLAHWLCAHLVEVWVSGLEEQMAEIVRHCSYEKRRRRQNYYEQLFASPLTG